MSTPLWSLTHSATTKSLELWGLRAGTLHRESLGVDTLQLTAPGQAADSAAILPYGAEIILRRSGTPYFRGVCTSTPVQSTAHTQHVEYRIEGPGYELANRIYRQIWAMQGSDGEYRAYRKPHLFLGSGIDLTPDGTGLYTGIPTAIYIGIHDVIEDILDYAIAQGAAIAYDISHVPNTKVPIAEHRDGITCAQAIVQMLRWLPDTIGRWDYATTPPTLHLDRRADLTALSLTLGTPPFAEAELTPRYDLQVPCVRITYERIDTINDVTIPIEVVETYPATQGHAVQQVFGTESYYDDPAGRQLAALVATCDLKGASANTSTATVTTAAIALSSGTWWGAHLPTHSEEKIQTIEIEQYAGTMTNPADPEGAEITWNATTYPRELTRGAYYTWMGYAANKATMSCRAKITYLTKAGQQDIRWEDLSCSIIVTSVPLGQHTYTTTTTAESGDVIPYRTVGGNTITLSQDIYDSLSTLQWSGRIGLRETEAGSLLSLRSLPSFLGTAINILGSANAAWSTMAAMVQSVDEDIHTGATTLSVGPPDHLGIQDLLQLFSLTRNRWRYTNPAAQAGGMLQSTTPTDLTPRSSGAGAGSSIGAKGHEKFSVATTNGHIVIDGQPDTGMSLTLTPLVSGLTASVAAIRTADLVDSGGFHHGAQFREVLYCETNGTQHRILVLCSKPYDPANGTEYNPITGA